MAGFTYENLLAAQNMLTDGFLQPTAPRSETEERHLSRLRANTAQVEAHSLMTALGTQARITLENVAAQVFTPREHLTAANAWFLIDPDPNSIVWNQRNDIGHIAQ